MSINTSSSMSTNLWIYYDKKLLQRLTKSLVLEQLGLPSTKIPMGMGDTCKWLRYAERHATTPASFQLVEGVAPTEATITSYNVTAQAIQYGNWAAVSDKLEYTAIDPVIESIGDVLMDEAAELVDTIIRNELDTNLPNQFANGKATLVTTGVDDRMTTKEALKAATTLKKNNVKPMDRGFVGIISPASMGDVKNDTNIGSWVDLNKYTANDSALYNGEEGKAFGVRFLESSNVSSTTTGTLGSATVYSNLVLGKDCFGTVKLGSKNVEMIIKDAKDGGPAIPLNQYSAVGYKLLGFVAKYLGGASVGTSDLGIRVRCGSGF